jgi:DNA-directed RNA polymerase subunit beta'
MLEGLKENVIVGRLIPAGTGGNLRRYQKLANERDEKLLEERRQASPQLEEFPAEIEDNSGGSAA